VNAPRRRLPSWIGEEVEDASDVRFRKHTSKVLYEQGMKGRKRRWEEKEEGNGCKRTRIARVARKLVVRRLFPIDFNLR